MDRRGKMVREVEIKSDGDVFHEIFRYRPHHISQMSPANIQNVDLHEGDWGTVGSVIFWNYTHDGKEKTAKEVIVAIDEEKKLVTFKVVEGDLMKLYKNFIVHVHVDTKGENNLVTWTFEYEKLHGNVEDPNTLMDFCIVVTKDMESHHLSGKMVRDVEIKSDGDVFHEIFRCRPHHISTMSPGNIQGVDLHEGDWGTVGSVITWNYTDDGKKKTAKEVIEAIDEEKKLVIFKVVEGDHMKLYKNFIIHVHVDTKGENNLVTWTFEYEKLHGDVEDPNTLMNVAMAVTKDIETHHLK